MVPEAGVEQAALTWLVDLGCSMARGPDIAAGPPGAERDTLLQRLVSGELRVWE